MRHLSINELVSRLKTRDPLTLSKCITILESSRLQDLSRAAQILDALPPPKDTFRVGFTGPPGVGKSTLVDALGKRYLETPNSDDLAVLAIDPSGVISGGSLLGDKTRMTHLSTNPRAFVRPSPSGGVLGGIAAATHESIRVCEASGYSRVFVESVGVGQSEVALASVTDCAVLLLGPSLGDGLQAIKRGIMEVADIVVVNKADEGTPLGEAAARAAAEAKSSLALMCSATPPLRWPDKWKVPVILTSATTGRGLDALLAAIEDYRAKALAADPPRAWTNYRSAHYAGHVSLLEARRGQQAGEHLEASFVHLLRRHIATVPRLAALFEDARARVSNGSLATRAAVDELLHQTLRECGVGSVPV